MCNNNEGMEKRFVVECRVLNNREIAPGVYQMSIGGEGARQISRQAKAGQFINVYLKDKSRLLPRPISLCHLGENSMDIVYKIVGGGTQELSGYKEGESIRVSSNLGNGFHLEQFGQNQRVLLIGGGVGVPPMIQLAKELKERGAEVTAVFGFPGETYLTEEIRRYCAELYICTENGQEGFPGTVLDCLKAESLTGDGVFACGPKPMLKALAEYCREQELPLQVSLEEKMGCGFGACVGCVVKIREHGIIRQRAVCKDGPVFNGSEVIWSE